jgi:hypothetical protein
MDTKQKSYIATYYSDGNLGGMKEIHIAASSISEAQDKFFTYLKSLPLYRHMWHLDVRLRQLEETL